MIEHLVRDGLLARERVFRLDDLGLTVEDKGVPLTIPYRDIVHVTISTYPNFGGHHGQLIARTRSGKKVTIRSHHYAGLGDFETRQETYVPLVQELVRRIASTNPAAQFKSGSRVFRLFWLLMLCVFVILAALLAIATFGGGSINWETLGAVIVMLLLVSFCWDSFKNSRQGTIDPDNIPSELLEF